MADVFVENSSLQAIANAIRKKTGGTDTYKPGQMAAAIEAIEMGGSGGGTVAEPLDPKQVYAERRPKDWLPMPVPEADEVYLLFHIPVVGVTSLIAFTATCTGNYKVELGTMANGAFSPISETSVTSGTTYEAELAASDWGHVTSNGMAQCMIKVSGSTITNFKQATHSKKTSPFNFVSWNIVEVSYNLPNGTFKMMHGGGAGYSLSKLKFCSVYAAKISGEASEMFSYCENLITIPVLEIGNVLYAANMFNYCKSIVAIPQLKTTGIKDMMYMFANCISLAVMPQLDTSSVLDIRGIFINCYSLTKVPQMDTSKATNMSDMFKNCYSLKKIPELDTSSAKYMEEMFYNCNSLTAIPQMDTSKATNMYRMFYNCSSLMKIPQMNTSSVTNMQEMFYNCNSLTEIPQMDTSKVTNMSRMFYGCYSLKEIPLLDTSNTTNMSEMFYYCVSLTDIPDIDTGNVTTMNYTFSDCYLLKKIPQLDTSKVTNMGYAFSGCQLIEEIPPIDTSKVTNMTRMFYGCDSLMKIPQLNTSKVTTMSNILQYSNSLISLKLDPTVTGWTGCAISLKDCSLGHTALVEFFNSLPTITSSKAITLTGNPGVSELTDAEKAIATGKGWTLTL